MAVGGWFKSALQVSGITNRFIRGVIRKDLKYPPTAVGGILSLCKNDLEVSLMSNLRHITNVRYYTDLCNPLLYHAASLTTP